MKKLALLLALFALVFVVNSYADLAPLKASPTPKTKTAKQIDSQLYIRLDKDAKEAQLVIPREMVKNLRAALDEANSNAAMASTGGINFGSGQTVIAGILMSLALVFGGVWFVRSKQTKTPKVIASIAFLLFGGAIVAFANMARPLEAPSITSKLFDKEVFSFFNFASGKIKVEISDSANEIELRVPKVEEDKEGE